MSQSASVVVGRPLPVIESLLWNVTTWTACLSDVVSVRRASHERYLVGLRAGRRVDEVVVVVRWNARHHRFFWKALEGPAWTGDLRLSAINGRRTRLELETIATPRTFLGGLAEMVGSGRRDLSDDVQRLHDLLASLPEPVRPAHLPIDGSMPEPVAAAVAALVAEPVGEPATHDHQLRTGSAENPADPVRTR